MPVGAPPSSEAVLTAACVDDAAGRGGGSATVRPRPRWLRALGQHDPPPQIAVGRRTLQRVTIFKHDAFAATALYADPADPGYRVVGKFARRQSAFGVPMGWLGRWFHAREQAVAQRMADVETVPAALGQVWIDRRPGVAAAARPFIEGQPLAEGQRPGDDFFPQLQRLIEGFHARRLAVVDLHKRDNILVDPAGRPHLMDFQISLAAPAAGTLRGGAVLRWLDPRTWLLGPAQRADRYHLMKHWVRHRPDQLSEDQRDLDRYRPLGVRLWRRGIRPVHRARRRLFLQLKIRTGRGEAETEVAPDRRP